ncbi:MAG: transcription elongation factor GreA [Solirubrobacteraceae bacterium]
MDRIAISAEELETIQRELHQLESAGRKEVAARIKTAREWGDLKENAEYHAAKEDQARLETQIARLRAQVLSADVIQLTTSAEIVQHGSTVSYTDRETNRKQTFRLVSPFDARPSEGALSVASPVARALIGRRAGDVIEVQTPNGVRSLSVDSIS